MTRMNEVVGICLHRALRSSVFFWGRRPWFLRDAAARCGNGVEGASVPGEQFTRGAGVSKGNDAAAAARVAQRQRGCCALCGCLGRCSARAVRPGDAVRGSASRKMNQRRVRSARCANKLCRRLAQAALASVLLAARADSYAGLSDAIDSYPPPYDGSVRTLTLREILVFRR